MRRAGLLIAALTWVTCWLIAPASWWFNARILNQEAFAATMQDVLLTDDVDRRIAVRASSQVIEQTRRFVHDTAPAFAAGADALIDQAEPVVTELVGKAVNSQPGERAMLAVSRQAHGVFLAWLNHDSLGPPGLQADLASGQARLDLDELLAGQQFGIGPLQVPMAGLDLPGLAVPVPLPPDWLRNPLTWLRAALLPALIGIALAAAAMLTLDRPRLRTLGVASASTAVVCGGAALTGRIFWRTSGAESADWQVTRAMTALLVDPLLTAYAWVGAAMFVVTAIALVRGRHHLVDAQPPA